MPANTVNRGYPYSIPADPADVPQAMEDFANAVDVDVQSQWDRLTRRPVAKAWSTTPQTFQTVTSGTDFIVNFDNFQVNTDNFATLSGGRVTPTLPGFYFAIATVSFGKPSGAVTPTNISTIMLFNNVSVISRSGVNGTVLAADNTAEIVAAGGQLMNGTSDWLTAAFQVTAPSTVPIFTVYTRSLTIIRMTQS
jgi:hypothetical protein